jgi:hypothetical protein
LLPERFLGFICEDQEPSLEFIANIADKFNTSLTATALRYLYFSTEPCAIVYSKDGRIKWFQGSKDFNELGFFIDVHSKLDPSSLAIRYFQGQSLPDSQKSVPASTWFVPGKYRRNSTIIEQSWSMPRYHSVLTLLWIEDDISEDDVYEEDDD